MLSTRDTRCQTEVLPASHAGWAQDPGSGLHGPRCKSWPFQSKGGMKFLWSGMNTRPDWDSYFLAIALVVSSRSHDRETRHGAVITDIQHRIIGVGYNGYPRHGDDERLPSERPDKYDFMVHAELNAILNCRSSTDLSAIYITGAPCPCCALAIIQAGIRSVVYGNRSSNMVTLVEQRKSVDLFRRWGVLVRPVLSRLKIDRALEWALGAEQEPST